MVFQSYTLFPWLTVRENVCFGLRERGVAAARQDEIARYWIDKVGLAGFEHHYPKMLSGGMQQRTAIARALANDPKILLLDEPFGALDNQTRSLMQELLLAIWEAERKTVLFVTHDIEEAIFMANRVVVMSARPGRIKADVPVTLAHPRHYTVKTTPEFSALKARAHRGDPRRGAEGRVTRVAQPLQHRRRVTSRSASRSISMPSPGPVGDAHHAALVLERRASAPPAGTDARSGRTRGSARAACAAAACAAAPPAAAARPRARCPCPTRAGRSARRMRPPCRRSSCTRDRPPAAQVSGCRMSIARVGEHVAEAPARELAFAARHRDRLAAPHLA